MKALRLIALSGVVGLSIGAFLGSVVLIFGLSIYLLKLVMEIPLT